MICCKIRGASKLNKSTFWYFIARAVSGAASIFVIYIFTSILSAESYGRFAVLLSLISVLSSLMYQWLGASLLRFGSGGGVDHRHLSAEVINLFLVTSLLVVPVAAAGSYLVVLDFDIYGFSIVAAGAIALGAHSTAISYYNARGMVGLYGLALVSRTVIASMAGVALVFAGFDFLGALGGMVIGATAAVCLLVPKISYGKSFFDRYLRLEMARYGIPLIATTAATLVVDVSDRFMLNWLIGPTAVGGYAAAYDLSQQSVGALLGVFMLTFYPRTVAVFEKFGMGAAKGEIRRLAQMMLLVGPTLGVIFIGLRSEIASIVVGKAVRSDVETVLPIVSIAILFGCFKNYVFDMPFKIEKKTTGLLKNTLIMAVSNMTLNLALIPVLGVVGAAIATLITFIIGTCASIASNIDFWRTTRLAREVASVCMAVIPSFIVAFMPHFAAQKSEVDSFTATALAIFLYLGVTFLRNTAGVRSIIFSYQR